MLEEKASLQQVSGSLSPHELVLHIVNNSATKTITCYYPYLSRNVYTLWHLLHTYDRAPKCLMPFTVHTGKKITRGATIFIIPLTQCKCIVRYIHLVPERCLPCVTGSTRSSAPRLILRQMWWECEAVEVFTQGVHSGWSDGWLVAETLHYKVVHCVKYRAWNVLIFWHLLCWRPIVAWNTVLHWVADIM